VSAVSTPRGLRDRGWPAVVARKLSALGRRVWSAREVRIYSLGKEYALSLNNPQMMSKDELADLLVFQPAGVWPTRQRFLGESLKKVEAGHHFYTRIKNGTLEHCGWLTENQNTGLFREMGGEYQFPPGSAVLYGFYTHPQSRGGGGGLYLSALQETLHDAASIAGVNHIYTAVMADDKPSRDVIEKIDFKYQGSLFQTVRFGRTTNQSTLKSVLDPASGAGSQRTFRVACSGNGNGGE
jgi:hypothetical protein